MLEEMYEKNQKNRSFMLVLTRGGYFMVSICMVLVGYQIRSFLGEKKL